MEAPDKVYLHGYDFSKKPVNTWSEHPAKGMRGYKVMNKEYICKEALLEWAKECKSDVADDVSHGDAFACGYNCGMNELIEKINSL